MRRVLPQHAVALVAVLASMSLVLAGCGGDDKKSEEKAPASQQVANSEEIASTWPLTGLPVTGDDRAEKPYPVLVTKIDNTDSSAPQLGLGKADLVIEELVEGGLTRLAAFFYSDLPTKVGPVRSMRASDIGIVSPAEASVVTSGAAGVTIARIKKAGITYYPEGAPGVSRDTSRSAPYNVFADLTEVAKTAETDESRPGDYLPWGDEKDFPAGQPASSLVASFGGGHSTEWKYDGKGYVNDNSYSADGDHFPATTILVLRVKVGDAGYLDPAGSPVPETKLTGTGQAMLFHDGRLVRGTWKKSALDAPISLSTVGGDLTVPAGKVWIELVPAADGDVTFTK